MNLEIKIRLGKYDELALGTKQGNLGLHSYCTPQAIYKDNKGLVRLLQLQLLNPPNAHTGFSAMLNNHCC